MKTKKLKRLLAESPAKREELFLTMNVAENGVAAKSIAENLVQELTRECESMTTGHVQSL